MCRVCYYSSSIHQNKGYGVSKIKVIKKLIPYSMIEVELSHEKNTINVSFCQHS